MKDPLISVIVPVYKVEKYLDFCIRSIVNQTYKNLEIILVDDGSPDNCPRICDEWAQKDQRITVIHKENGGLSDARNAGLKIATGDYIGFVDSDDWIDLSLYEVLVNEIKTNCSDIAACGVKLYYEDTDVFSDLTISGSFVFSTEEALRALITENELKYPVYYKLYKAQIIKNILFPIGKIHEDVFWSYQAIAAATKVSVCDHCFYYYRQRTNSIMSTSYSINRLDGLDAKVERNVFIKQTYPCLAPLADTDLWFSCIYSLQMCLKNSKKLDYKQARNKIINISKSCIDKNISCIKSCKQKLWYFLSLISLPLTCKIRNLVKIGF